MKISDSNPIQFWLASRVPFNDVEIYGIDKKLFYQSAKTSDHHRTDVKFDFAAAPTWDAARSYNMGELVYSTLSGQRYESLTNANVGNDPLNFLGGFWKLADFTFIVPDAKGPTDIDNWKVGSTYNTGERAFYNTLPLAFVYESLIDGNTGINPTGFGALGVSWKVVVQDPSVYKMLAYIGDVFYDDFVFENVRPGSSNQFVTFDYSIFPALVNVFLKLKIASTTVKPSLLQPSGWTSAVSFFDVASSTAFVKNPLGGSETVKSYQRLYAKATYKITIKYRVTIVGAFSGDIDVHFFAADSAGGDVSTRTYVRSGAYVFPFEFTVAGTYDIVETMTLTSDCFRLYIYVLGNFFGGTPSVTIDNIVGDNGIDSILASSDCIDIQNDYNSSLLIEYTNLADYDSIAYRDVHPVNKLRIQPAHFWEHQDPREEEDYADSKGDIITLKTKIEKQQKLSVSYFPAFMHTKLAHIFNHDFIRIDGVIYKGRVAYAPVPIERSTLYAGSVWLTEQGSVLVNIGGQVTDESGGIFDIFEDDTFE